MSSIRMRIASRARGALHGRPTVAASVIRGVLDQARQGGIPIAGLLQTLGLDGTRDGAERVPLDVFFRLWSELETRSGRADVGLYLAERAHVAGTFGIADYLFRTSRDLGEAFRKLERHAALIHSDWAPRLRVDHGEAHVDYVPRRGTPRQLSEWVAASWVVVGRQMVGARWRPIRVTFAHVRPRDCRSHQRLFGCPVHFGFPANAIVFDPALLGVVSGAFDPRLARVMEDIAARMTADVAMGATLDERVRAVIQRELTSDVQLATVARRLGMSSAALKRALRAEGAPTYRALLAAVRRDIALRLLESNVAVGTVAEMLGYSEPSAFYRAFRRWTGTSPGALPQTTDGE